ncbi:MAG: D-alanyl-D-alanine carboxypeptidase family protein [Pseudomonadota bacterium]
MLYFFGALLFGRLQTSMLYNMTEKRVVFGSNMHAQVYPASLTKKMTLYLLFKALKEKKVYMNTKMKISKYAASQPRLRLELTPGDTITVREAILGIIIRSCNCCSFVVAEHLAGSVPAFVNQMNATAKVLHLQNSHFRNPSGWHHEKQKTTAWDMTKLACALYRHFPEYRHFFKEKKFTYKGKTVHTHNRIASMYPGAIGLKTGFTCPAGFNLTAICAGKDTKGKKHHVVSVVMGEASPQVREKKTCQLFNRFYKNSSFKASTKKVKRSPRSS